MKTIFVCFRGTCLQKPANTGHCAIARDEQGCSQILQDPPGLSALRLHETRQKQFIGVKQAPSSFSAPPALPVIEDLQEHGSLIGLSSGGIISMLHHLGASDPCAPRLAEEGTLAAASICQQHSTTPVDVDCCHIKADVLATTRRCLPDSPPHDHSKGLPVSHAFPPPHPTIPQSSRPVPASDPLISAATMLTSWDSSDGPWTTQTAPIPATNSSSAHHHWLLPGPRAQWGDNTLMLPAPMGRRTARSLPMLLLQHGVPQAALVCTITPPRPSAAASPMRLTPPASVKREGDTDEGCEGEGWGRRCLPPVAAAGEASVSVAQGEECEPGECAHPPLDFTRLVRELGGRTMRGDESD